MSISTDTVTYLPQQVAHNINTLNMNKNVLSVITGAFVGINGIDSILVALSIFLIFTLFCHLAIYSHVTSTESIPGAKKTYVNPKRDLFSISPLFANITTFLFTWTITYNLIAVF